MPSHITIEPAEGIWVVRAGGAVIGESSRALALREGSRDPVIYFPREDVAMQLLESTATVTHCPHKGDAGYFSIVTKSTTLPDAVWTYVQPKPDVGQIAEMLAFDPAHATVEQL